MVRSGVQLPRGDGQHERPIPGHGHQSGPDSRGLLCLNTRGGAVLRRGHCGTHLAQAFVLQEAAERDGQDNTGE